MSARANSAVARSRTALLAGAARAFAERGVRGTTMRDVATAAGVAKGTVYNHFRTKDELARTLLNSELDRLEATVAGRRLDVSLSLLADEVGGHPVLRRIVADEPDLAARLLAVPPDRWTRVVARLSAALGIEEAVGELVGRWLLGTALRPAPDRIRDRQARALAGLLTASSRLD